MIVLFTAVFFLGFSALASEIRSEVEHPHSFGYQVGQFFARRCLKNKDLEYLEQLMHKLADFLGCIRKIMPKHIDEHDDQIERHCFIARREVLQCMQQLMDALQPCLHGEEEYLPKLIMKSFSAYLEYFCEHVRILTAEGLIDSNMSKCLNKFKKYLHNNPHHTCFTDALHITDHLKGTPITKEELCKDFDVLYACYEHKFHTYCPESPQGWQFQGGLLNATRSPCYES